MKYVRDSEAHHEGAAGESISGNARQGGPEVDDHENAYDGDEIPEIEALSCEVKPAEYGCASMLLEKPSLWADQACAVRHIRPFPPNFGLVKQR